MSEREIRRVGFVGLGNMGTPMVRRLLHAGYAVVGFDVDVATRDALASDAGFEAAAAAVDVARATDAIILMLPSSDVVEAVLVNSGVLAAATPGTVIIDSGSSEPRRTQDLARRARLRGVDLIDAPVSGGVAGAVAGKLTVMVSGDGAAIDRVQGVLDVIGSSVLRVGEVGAADAIKALNNLMSATHLLVTSEALIAARRFGLDPATVLEVVNRSSGKSGSTENKWPNFILTETYDSGFGLRLMLKDMRIALGLLMEAGVPAALSEQAVELWESAAAELAPQADHTEIARWLDSATMQGGAK